MDIVIYLFFLGMSLPSCSHSQAPFGSSAIPAPMFTDIMREKPFLMNEAMRRLANMLHTEARHGHRMRRFGRSGVKRRDSYKFVQSFLGSTPYDKHLSYPSYVQSAMVQMIRHKYTLNNDQVKELMAKAPPFLKPSPHVVGPDTLPPKPNPDACPYAKVICDGGHKYRSYDGKCNNLQSPYWGSSHYPLARFLPPHYADAIEGPRVGKTGYALPSVRLVSSTIHWDVDIPHHAHTLMLMQFGQFLDHDISRTAISKLNMDPDTGFSEDLEDVSCGTDGCQTDGLENAACMPIDIPRNDSIYNQEPCLMFVRSQQAPNPNCRIGPREQLNQISSFLDCSHIYGSTLKEANDLRDFSDINRGQLKTTPHPGGPQYKSMLPQDPAFKDCKGDNHTILCFKAGDGRVNEFMGLATHHLLWMREHNRVEDHLHHINPHWDGETLYQEARRLVTAMWQHVVYAEWLPILLGPKIMQRYGLYLHPNGYWNGYDQTVNPTCSNSFATAAMRFGHSLIQGELHTRNLDYSPREAIPVSTMFRRPHMMYFPPHAGTDAMLRGFLTQDSQSMDSFISKQVTSHLFADHPPLGLGEDLASLNMQRAREHGIPGYNYYREWCGLKRAQNWEDLIGELPGMIIDRFKRLYKHVDDIDLFPAGISEYAYPGSLLGPTFSCIIASQYRNLKYGDRFWFENAQHNPYPFTQAQMREIRKSSIAKVICNNADSITHIQPKVMIHPRSKALENIRLQNKQPTLGKFAEIYDKFPNEVVPCQAIPDMDLSAWEDGPKGFIPRPFHPNALPRRPRSLDDFLLKITDKGIVSNRGLDIDFSNGSRYDVKIRITK